jgi:DNA-binding GntR family transcriptional regulator
MLHTTLPQQIYETLREKIISGAIPPGASLSEVSLARECEVSRTPLREAIRRLVSEGFAASVPHCGAKVMRPTREAASEIYQIREALEGIATREAALRLDTREIERLRTKFDRVRAAIAAGDKSDVGDEIHDVVIQASGNSRLIHLMSIYRSQVTWLQRIVSDVPLRLEASFREHDIILSALEARDPEWAERAARAHVRNTLADLYNELAPEPDNRLRRRRRRLGASPLCQHE